MAAEAAAAVDAQAVDVVMAEAADDANAMINQEVKDALAEGAAIRVADLILEAEATDEVQDVPKAHQAQTDRGVLEEKTNLVGSLIFQILDLEV